MRIIKNILKLSSELSKKQATFLKPEEFYLSWVEYKGKKRRHRNPVINQPKRDKEHSITTAATIKEELLLVAAAPEVVVLQEAPAAVAVDTEEEAVVIREVEVAEVEVAAVVAVVAEETTDRESENKQSDNTSSFIQSFLRTLSMQSSMFVKSKTPYSFTMVFVLFEASSSSLSPRTSLIVVLVC